MLTSGYTPPVFFARSKTVVGLDIGSSSVKLVELKEGMGGHLHLVRLGIEPIARGAVVDDAIADPSLAADAVRKLIESTGVRNPNFATSVRGGLIIRIIELPAMGEVELAESFLREADPYIPYDIEDAYLDYQTLTSAEEIAAGAESMEVLLVATWREKVDAYVSVISQCGKKTAVVDVEAFAVQNAYELNYGLDPQKTVALINIGASVTNVNIIVHGQSVFWRDLTIGGHAHAEALQRKLGVSFNRAERLARGESTGRHEAGTLREVLDAVSGEVARSIATYFDYFHITSEETVDEIVLSGGGALIPNLPNVLSQRFEVPAKLLDPFRRIRLKEVDAQRNRLASLAPILTVAVGLATRKTHDKHTDLRTEGRRPVIPEPAGRETPDQSSLARLKVFLCHASEDKLAVRALYSFLREKGVDVWLDEENILPGQEWRSEINKAIKKSHVVIVCLSRLATTKRGFVQKEIREALDVADEQPEDTIFIVPARLEECEVPQRLSHLHYVDLFEPAGHERLMKALAHQAEKTTVL